MAKEIKAAGLTAGLNYFAVVVNPAGLYWTGTGNNFGAASGITWSAAGIALTADATITRDFAGDFPAAITTAAEYIVKIYSRAGGSPVVTDVQGTPAATGQLDWDGTQEITELTTETTVMTTASLVGSLPSTLATAHGAGSWGAGASGSDVAVTHNTPTANIWRVVDSQSVPINGATVNCYPTTNYVAGTGGPSNSPGQTKTAADGTWTAPIVITPPNSGSINYTLVFSKPGTDLANTGTITVSSAGVVTTP